MVWLALEPGYSALLRHRCVTRQVGPCIGPTLPASEQACVVQEPGQWNTPRYPLGSGCGQGAQAQVMAQPAHSPSERLSKCPPWEEPPSGCLGPEVLQRASGHVLTLSKGGSGGIWGVGLESFGP